MRRRSFVVGSTALAALPAAGQPVPFADEAPPDLVRWRAGLMAALAARDAPAVVAMAHPAVKLGFGGGEGPAALSEALTRPASPDPVRPWASDLFTQLHEALRLGGRMDGPDGFWAPWYWLDDLPAGLDPYAAHVVTGTGVALRAAPSAEGALIRRLSHEYVPAVARTEGTYWGVETRDGAGFVAARYLRAVIDLRVELVRDGWWQLRRLVAGD